MSTRVKDKIALLGLGQRASDFYQQEMRHQKDVIRVDQNFEKINALLPDSFEALKPIIQRILCGLEGYKRIVIPNITLHQTVDLIDLPIGIENAIIHPVLETGKLLKPLEPQKIYVFGSLYTMNAPYIREHPGWGGLEVASPNKMDQRKIDEFRKNSYQYLETSEEVTWFQNTVASYAQRGTVVLACSELSLFMPERQNVYDMAQIQIAECVKALEVSSITRS